MEEQKTKIFFITTINASLLKENRFYFDLDEKILDLDIISSKLNNTNQKYNIYINEFTVDQSLIEDENSGDIKINLNIVGLSNEVKNPKKYEIIINYTKNRVNFIFGLKIGNLVNKKSFSDSKFDSYLLDFNKNFIKFHDSIMKKNRELQAEYLENLAIDAMKYLEDNKNEKICINFEIIFFLFVYAKTKNSDISFLIEIINRNSDKSDFFLSLFKKEQINDFLLEIFSNYEKNYESWPFNYINENFEENLEEEENYDDNVKEKNKHEIIDSTATKNEIVFIWFFWHFIIKMKEQKKIIKFFSLMKE